MSGGFVATIVDEDSLLSISSTSKNEREIEAVIVLFLPTFPFIYIVAHMSMSAPLTHRFPFNLPNKAISAQKDMYNAQRSWLEHLTYWPIVILT